MTTAALPRLLTVHEVAEALRLSPQTVIRNARAGRLPAPVVIAGGSGPGRLRWRESDILAIVDPAGR